MILKIIGVIVVVICGAASFLVKKVLPAILKREVNAEDITNFKLLMLGIVVVGALLVIFPDYF